MRPGSILESKETLDGRVQTFACTGLLLTSRLAVVRFDHAGERHAGDFFFPTGSHTLGYFWRARPYTCYRFVGPDGGVIAYRFDVVDRVRIRAGHVRYRDLLLDVWVSPTGTVGIEDEDEVAAATADGQLTPAQLDRIARTRALLLRAHPRITAECERIAADTDSPLPTG